MLAQTLIFLVTTAGDLLVLALLLRFILQLTRAPARNQLALFLAAVTDFMVRPTRRLIPGWWGFDFATLVLAWVTAMLELAIVIAIKGYALESAGGLAVAVIAALALLNLIRLTIYIIIAAVILQAVLSWVQPYNALAPLLSSLTGPFLRPVRKRVPTIANVDLSPLIVVVVGQLLLAVPLVWLESAVSRML
jgi:YggT family protein